MNVNLTLPYAKKQFSIENLTSRYEQNLFKFFDFGNHMLSHPGPRFTHAVQYWTGNMMLTKLTQKRGSRLKYGTFDYDRRSGVSL